jgi:hypothetical protein
MKGKDIENMTTGEIVVLMRDTIQELVDAEGSEISAADAIAKITEAILYGAIVIAAVNDDPISMVLGSIAGSAFESELSVEVMRAQARAQRASMN